MSQPRVTVVDSKNHERVLGTIPAPRTEPLGRYFAFPIFRNDRAYLTKAGYAMPGVDEMRLEIVNLTTKFVGWTHVTELGLSSAAPLEDLMKLRDFRLPGEDFRSAYHRAVTLDRDKF